MQVRQLWPISRSIDFCTALCTLISEINQRGSAATTKILRWARLCPIRTVSAVELEFVVFTQKAFQYQRIGPKARTLKLDSTRMPESFCGFPRVPDEGPVLYPPRVTER